MKMTGAALKQRLLEMTDGEALVIDGVEWVALDGDFHIEYPEATGHLDRDDRGDEFIDEEVYEVDFAGGQR